LPFLNNADVPVHSAASGSSVGLNKKYAVESTRWIGCAARFSRPIFDSPEMPQIEWALSKASFIAKKESDHESAHRDEAPNDGLDR